MSFLKSNCVLCDTFVDESISLCDACRDDLPRIENACKLCALPMSQSINDGSEICGGCLSQKNHVDYAESLFVYENPIAYLIGEMKFQQRLSVAAVFAEQLKNHFQEEDLEHGVPELIIPMPLYKKRLVERGFNQSLEIAKPLAKSLGIPLAKKLVERSKPTKTQTHLNKKQRRDNVLGCFELLKKPAVSHLVILDDVVTTGATSNELAKILKQSGVEKIGVWSLARAELN